MQVNSVSAIHILRKILIFISTLVCCCQTLFYFSPDNLICSILCLLGSLGTIFYCFRVKIFVLHPISSLMILGFAFFYFIFPPLLTIAENKSLIYNLEMPKESFFNAFLCFGSIVFAHKLYRHSLFANRVKAWLRNRYDKIGVFGPVSEKQIYAIGFLGLGLQILLLAIRSNDILFKFFEGIVSFAFLPFTIFYSKLFKINTNRSVISNKYLLIFYSVIVFFTGIAINSRSYLFNGIVTLLFMYFFMLIFGLSRINISFSKLFIGSLFLLIIVGPMSRLATVLQIVRADRNIVSFTTLVEKTLDAFNDDSRIKDYVAVSKIKQLWDEEYIDNSLFSRLCNIKYLDNSLKLGSRLTESEKLSLTKIEIDRVISLLPNPVLKFLGSEVDKELVQRGSMGDFLFEKVAKVEYAVGGFRTGSMIGSAYLIFDVYYPLAMVVMAFLTFIIVDSFFIIEKNINSFNFVFSPIAFLNIFSFCFYFTSAPNGMESFSQLFAFITRGFIQLIFIFVIVKYLTNIVNYFGKK